MIIPVVNVDITSLVQFLVFVSYMGLVYGLSVEIIGYHPFRMIKKTIQAANPPEERETLLEKENFDGGKSVNFELSVVQDAMKTLAEILRHTHRK